MLFSLIRVVIVEVWDLARAFNYSGALVNEADYSEHMILQEEHFIDSDVLGTENRHDFMCFG